jgi:hypothetical protein
MSSKDIPGRPCQCQSSFILLALHCYKAHNAEFRSKAWTYMVICQTLHGMESVSVYWSFCDFDPQGAVSPPPSRLPTGK